MYVWVEWICKKCAELHVARFDVIIYSGSFHSPINPHWKENKAYYVLGDIKVNDVAYTKENRPKKSKKGGGSKVYAPWNTEIPRILEALKTYMLKYYSMKQDTLTLEVCSG